MIEQRGQASLPSEDVRLTSGLRRDSLIVEAPTQFQGPKFGLTSVLPDASLKQAKGIKLQHRLPGEDVRMIGIRRDGLVVEAPMQFQGPEFGLTSLLFNTSLQQLKEIKLQHRPYTWIEFRDVIVQPGKKRGRAARHDDRWESQSRARNPHHQSVWR